MTIDKYIAKLRETRSKRWNTNKHGYVFVQTRLNGICLNPITVLSATIVGPERFSSVYRELGLSYKNAWKICRAMHRTSGHDRNLRRRIMRAVGLSK